MNQKVFNIIMRTVSPQEVKWLPTVTWPETVESRSLGGPYLPCGMVILFSHIHAGRGYHCLAPQSSGPLPSARRWE